MHNKNIRICCGKQSQKTQSTNESKNLSSFNDTMNKLARYAVNSKHTLHMSYANLNSRPSEITHKVHLVNTPMTSILTSSNSLEKKTQVGELILNQFVTHNFNKLSDQKMNNNMFFAI